MPTLTPTSSQPLVGVPLGTILAYVSPIAGYLPDNWQICDGSPVTDTKSPFLGQTLPMLTDNRYLVGVAQTAEANTPVAPSVPADGNHSHGGVTSGFGGPFGANARQIGGGGDSATGLAHEHTISADGQHTHPGEVIPKSLTVYYIMRIK